MDAVLVATGVLMLAVLLGSCPSCGAGL